MSESKSYHHGNLRRALLDEAVRAIEEKGLDALSLRDLSRRLGVSHAAPTYHFAEKRDLLTAIAAEGYDLLVGSLTSAPRDDFLETGVAYARFAVGHPVHLQLMFAPSLLRDDDPALEAARNRAGELLYGSAASLAPSERQLVGIAGWCLMHGFANLWLNGNFREISADPLEAAKRIAQVTFRAPS